MANWLFFLDAGTNELSGDDLGIITVRPRNPQFAIWTSRFESYKGKWGMENGNATQTPAQLSSAGFFYVGALHQIPVCLFFSVGRSIALSVKHVD